MIKNHNFIYILLIFNMITPAYSYAFMTQEHMSNNESNLNKLSISRKIINKRHTISYAKKINSIPLVVSINPSIVNLEKNGSIDLDQLKPKVLYKLKPQELNSLIEQLVAIPVKISWLDKKGHKRRFKKQKHLHGLYPSNAAAALSLRIGSFSLQSGERYASKLFASMIAAYPEAILPVLHGEPSILLDTQTTAYALVLMMDKLDQTSTISIAKSASELTQIFIKANSIKDVENIKSALQKLLQESKRLIDKQYEGLQEQKVGVLLGSILSGIMHHAELIKEKDAKNIYITNTITNVIWAATTFIGMAPISSGLAAATGGGLSMAVVVASAIYGSVVTPHDYTPDIKEIQGNIETTFLGLSKSMSTEQKLSIVLLLQWMRSAIHVNGLSD